jgi:4-diphosphocytidyl-2-C-methyl-D-erythritol kinase
MPLHETARAKINLTLTVLGRRGDGYHDLESLVTFADVSDRVVLHPSLGCRITTSGPFAADIEGPNLLDRALVLLSEADAGLLLGAVELEKNIPVAAGLGGGSADAAALLRAVRRANRERAGRIDWHALAARLGADVPVCLAGVPALIRDVGDRIEPLEAPRRPPPLAAVLVNPRVALPTSRVFAALSRSFPPPRPSWGEGTDSGGIDGLLACIRVRGNDLEAAAISLQPVIADVKAAIAVQPGCQLAAMSGSGPTCFGIFDNDVLAAQAADALSRAHPSWWIVRTRLS